MRIRICRTPTRSSDGGPIEQFSAGLVYDIGTELARVFLAEGWAEPVGFDDVVTQPPNRIAAVVLVVDDETDLRALTTSFLTCIGYEVIEARHGEEAIARLTQNAPDLVLLDLNMPVMDGWQFLAAQQRLRDGQLAAIPVLLLTAADSVSDQVATLKAVGLVEKPFDPERLLAAIRAVLGR
jgi:CheY-like chemotaxis protein